MIVIKNGVCMYTYHCLCSIFSGDIFLLWHFVSLCSCFHWHSVRDILSWDVSFSVLLQCLYLCSCLYIWCLCVGVSCVRIVHPFMNNLCQFPRNYTAIWTILCLLYLFWFDFFSYVSQITCSDFTHHIHGFLMSFTSVLTFF